MTANKRTFEVDRFLTRQLLLRNPDNTPPAANQGIFTDGQGGTYYAPLASSVQISTTTGFNQIYLSDSNERIIADLSFNIIAFKEGPGIRFLKQGQNTIVFETSLLVPSTFTTISTPNGVITTTSPSTILNIETNYGVNVSVSTNKLIFAGNAAFGQVQIVNPSTIQQINATPTISSIRFLPGFGISLGQTGSNGITIDNTFSTYALNQVSIGPGPTGTYQFLNRFNNLGLTGGGNLQINRAGPSSILFQTNSFSKISTPAGPIYASTTGESLNIKQGYGLQYTISSNSLQIDTALPSSFSYISTARGIISTPYSVNTLTLKQGYGIDYEIQDQNLTIKLASTFGSAIVTETFSTVATANSILNLRQGDGILYSTTTTGALLIQATDFNKVTAGNVSIYSYNTALPNPTLNKGFTLVGGPGTNITADSVLNTITITTFSSVQVTGPAFAFSDIKVFSSCLNKYDPTTGYTSNTLRANPSTSAVLNMIGVQPMYTVTDSTLSNNIIYVGMDTSSLLSSINSELFSLSTVLDSTLHNLVTPDLSISTLSARGISSLTIDASSFSVLGSVFMSSNPTIPSYLTVNQISSIFIESKGFRISTINDTPLSTPLAVFNYATSSIGFNIGSNQPQANLEVNGVILAQIYATYSDSSLKNFKSPLRIQENELEILKPWNFTWKADNFDDIGFAAEDVEKIAPSAVRRAANGLRIVDYGRLSVIAISALQETNKRLAAVESTLVTLTKNAIP
jgi:hypothetical protein